MFQVAVGSGDSVTMSRSLFERLYFRPELIEEGAIVAPPQVRRRDVRVTVAEAGIHLRIQWHIHPSQGGVFSKTMSVSGFHAEELSWNGRPIPLSTQKNAKTEWEIEETVTGPSVLSVSGLIPREHPSFKQVLGPGLRLGLMGAASQTVRLAPDSEWFLHVPAGTDGVLMDRVLWHSKPDFLLKLSKEAEAKEYTRQQGIARMGIGLTAFSNRVVGQARIDWFLGTTQSGQLRVRVPSDMPDFKIGGPHVLSWIRRGNLVLIELTKKAPPRTVVMLHWEQSFEGQDVERFALPVLHVLGVQEQVSTVQFASSGEVDVVPSLRHAVPVSSEELPEYGRDLIQGTPVSSFQHRGVLKGEVHLLRYTPADAPPLIVDVSETTLAMSKEGRALGRTRLTVRNETATHLEVCIPKGVHLLGVTVSQQPAVLLKSDDCVRIQLPRSVASVKGGLAFPVDLLFRTHHRPWVRREARKVTWATVRNAPVAVHRTKVFLPPEYRSDPRVTARHTVDAFTEGEGLAYGYGLDGAREEYADALFLDAVADWMRNDFESAQRQLGALDEMGALNENIVRLQSNIDAVLDKKVGKKEVRDSAVTRRVRAQAKVRAGKRKMRQMDAMDEAEQALSSGDYDKAAVLYKEAQQITATLESLENSESREEKTNAAKISKGLKRAEEHKASIQYESAMMQDDSVYTEEAGGALSRTQSGVEGAVFGRSAPAPQTVLASKDLKEVVSEVPVDVPIQVAATRIDLVIPEWGESIQFQQLLLSPGEIPEVIIFAKKTWRK